MAPDISIINGGRSSKASGPAADDDASITSGDGFVRPVRARRTPDARLAMAQGAFFALSGMWPIVHLRSFEAVTGPKLEGWLVKTVGGLLTVVGAALFSAGARGKGARK